MIYDKYEKKRVHFKLSHDVFLLGLTDPVGFFLIRYLPGS